MAAFPKEITIDVEANMTVSFKTAERCLRLLEMWQEDNPDLFIVGTKDVSGKTFFEIKRYDKTTGD